MKYVKKAEKSPWTMKKSKPGRSQEEEQRRLLQSQEEKFS